MTMYMMLKHLHTTALAVSVLLFILRFIWLLIGSGQLQKKWVKILPHVVDTLLLGTAIGLCIVISQYPLQAVWLTGKLAGVIAYIVCGFWTLKWAKTVPIRCLAFGLALFCLAITAHIAVSKQIPFI